MKGLKLLVLACLLLPLGNVQAALNLGDTVESAAQEVKSVLGESDSIFKANITVDGKEIEITDSELEALTPDSTDLLAGGIIASSFILILFITLLILLLPLYVYGAITQMTIGKKLGYENNWFAWIPVLNTIMIYQLAGLSPWFVIINFLPLIITTFTVPFMLLSTEIALFMNLARISLTGLIGLATTVLGVITYMKISERRGYDKLLGLLTLVPVANLVLLGVLAWGKGKDEA